MMMMSRFFPTKRFDNLFDVLKEDEDVAGKSSKRRRRILGGPLTSGRVL